MSVMVSGECRWDQAARWALVVTRAQQYMALCYSKLLAKGTAMVFWRFLLLFHCFSGIVLSGFLTVNSTDSIENKWLTNVRMS